MEGSLIWYVTELAEERGERRLVRVIEVDLDQLGVRMPHAEVGMVIAQPFVDFTLEEPFLLKAELRDAAIAGIDATLSVARACAHGAEKTHFTIFPECTIPGLAGFDRIAVAMTEDRWPTSTVVIGGLDGLTRAQFGELIQRPNTMYDEAGSSLNHIRNDQWVNCCVTWVKLDSGEVRAWIQTKTVQAFVELNVRCQSMFKGTSIFLFKGRYADVNAPYRFATLICFDWIGIHGPRSVSEWLLHAMEQTAVETETQLPLNWLFVAQCNKGPSHESFMSQAHLFFNPQQYTRVLREGTCLVMANVAGSAAPGVAHQYGQTSVILATSKLEKPQSLPTYCAGEFQRPGNPLGRYKDAVFRERGACIHSFLQLNPSALQLGSSGRRFALADATVHPFPGTEDPRAPAGLVPATVKWVNDELDDPKKSLEIKYPDLPLAGAAGAAHQRLVSSLRVLPSAALTTTVFVATPGTSRDPDTWEGNQSNAVKHVLHTFSILDVARYPATFHGKGAQATIMKGDASLEVVAVIGLNHEECDKHVMDQLPDHRGQLLVISRDEDNTSWDPRMRTLFDQAAEMTSECNFTDPTSAVIRVGYRDVLNAYSDAANPAALKDAIDDAIT